ncbi:hypothetical protein [Dactylosporangium sp. NPDC048998]|uniref:hypothetical protein n=1 Tax=Dactylosporangium sp. NPDC048998 TaxID=3363976 RepID=UPI00371256E9
MPDLLARYGMEPDPAGYERSPGNSFVHMVAELLQSLDRPLSTLDTVVLAYHLPDLKIAEAASGYVATVCPGEPDVFSVSEQGVGAPFTALHILDRLRAAGERRGAVLVLDQSTAHYHDPDTRERQIRDCAVLLRTGEAAGADSTVIGEVVQEPVDDPAEALLAEARRLPDCRIVVGARLAEYLTPGQLAAHGIVAGPDRHLCTSPWLALADVWAPDRTTIVADYDPHAALLFRVALHPADAA